jgi:formylglycine-generating enzyme required for sulfatase activity
MPRIFISYRRTDSQNITERIHEHLAEVFGRKNVFQDVLSIDYGANFRKVLEEKVNACDILLVIIGTKWASIKEVDELTGQETDRLRLFNENDYVRIEGETGLGNPNTLVIPVLVNDASIPRKSQLPESLHDLLNRNAVSIRNNPYFEDDIRRLVRQLRPFPLRLVLITLVAVLFFVLSAVILVNNATLSLPPNQETQQAFLFATTVAARTPNQETQQADSLAATAAAQPLNLETQAVQYYAMTVEARILMTQTIAFKTEIAHYMFAFDEGTNTAETATFSAHRDTPTLTGTPTFDPQAIANEQSTRNAEMTRAVVEAQSTLNALTATNNEQWTIRIQIFDRVDMVLVPVGCFDMGSPTGDSREQPVIRQCISQPFWLDRTEVTNQQFADFRGQAADSAYWAGSSRPRESVTWFEARDFCLKRDARLPTEREWEYAARGPDNLVYPWGNTFVTENLVFGSNSGGQTADVGSRPRGVSWVGALDLSGNVWEWVSSAFKPYPYDASDGREEDASSSRVLRGGSWYYEAGYARAANRGNNSPTVHINDIGFRCARDFSPSDLTG